MRTLCLFLFCLLTTQAAFTRKNKRGHHYAVREASNGGGSQDGGYHYDNPSGGAMSALMMAHHEAMNSYSSSGGANADDGGGGQQYHSGAGAGHSDSQPYHSGAGAGHSDIQPYHSGAGAGHSDSQQYHSGAGAGHSDSQHYDYPPLGGNGNTGNGGGYQYNAPAASTSGSSSGSAAPAGFEDIQSFSAGVTAALQLEGSNQQGGHNVVGAAETSYSSGGFKGYDFNAALNGGAQNSIGGSSGSSDQFTGVQGEVIDENPPSIFKYKPHFGGKDINNLPHILPPGGKSIHELQEEADAKLRAIVAKAKMNQMEVLERISKLKTNYGFGTLGYDGFKDTRFNKMDKIDLGTHKAIDLGTSIDYNALKGSDGKLKLPVQNVYHTKTLGIHIPEPYPVKHEVAVPAPFPVPHPIPVPHHKPTFHSPLTHEEIAHFSADDGRGSHFGGYGSFGGNEGIGGHNFDFKFPKDASSSFNSVPSSFQGGSSSVTIEPSQSISESSSIGGLPYGAGTPNAAHADGSGGAGAVEYNMEHHESAGMFGLPAGSTSGALSEYHSPAHEQEQHYEQQGHTIASEAGAVQIPQMDISEHSHEHREEHRRPHTEYGPPR